jgi:putative toxin-antitoxin system antitoxin component (TIGR02293 family)
MTAAQMERVVAERTIEWAHRELELNYSEIGRALGADRRTVNRWRKRQSAPSPEHRERMEKLRMLKYLLEAVFENEADAQEWLHASVPILKGRSPKSLLREGEIDRVLGVLAGMESGAFI